MGPEFRRILCVWSLVPGLGQAKICKGGFRGGISLALLERVLHFTDTKEYVFN